MRELAFNLSDVDGLIPAIIVRGPKLDGVALRDLRASPQIHLVHKEVGGAAFGLDEAVLSFGVEPLADASPSRGRARGLLGRRPPGSVGAE